MATPSASSLLTPRPRLLSIDALRGFDMLWIDFSGIAARFLGGDINGFLDAHVASGLGTLLVAAMALILPVLLARYLDQKKIFIRL